MNKIFFIIENQSEEAKAILLGISFIATLILSNKEHKIRNFLGAMVVGGVTTGLITTQTMDIASVGWIAGLIATSIIAINAVFAWFTILHGYQNMFSAISEIMTVVCIIEIGIINAWFVNTTVESSKWETFNILLIVVPLLCVFLWKSLRKRGYVVI